MKAAAPYLTDDVNIDALMEMKGVRKETLQAVRGIDVPTLQAVKGIAVPTLRAIKESGLDPAAIKAATGLSGVDVSRLKAIGESTKSLDPASIREAVEMKK